VQIISRLEESDVFISLYSGLDKQWPAWEIGYFERLMNENDRLRKLVPIFFKKPPPAIAQYQGLDLDVPPEHLQCTLEEFRALIAAIDIRHPMCMFVIDQQAVTEKLRSSAGFPAIRREPEQDPVLCVQNMMLDIFTHLRASIQATFKPQKQVVIRTTDEALERSEPELPSDAVISPIGAGDPMSIFGLTNCERDWATFLQEVGHDEHVESWRAAIVSVITSSLDNRTNVDNGQIIVSIGADKAYRVILTSALKYYDGKREFHLYFVETLKRGEYGDRITTVLLKAIELTCRFRFMFFENGSMFSSASIHLTPPLTLPALAGKLLHELNLMRKDARESGLDQPAAWLELVNREEFQSSVEAFVPVEREIRSLCSRILEARGNEASLGQLREQLSATLSELDQATAGGNAKMIEQMTIKLQAETAR
jgi:hypothetical protein